MIKTRDPTSTSTVIQIQKQKSPPTSWQAFLIYGAPERIRTSDRSVRSRVLYPAELRVHKLLG